MSISAIEHITRIRCETFCLDEHGRSTGPNPLASTIKNCLDLLAEGLYTKNAHFIFELIQNAEDNRYGSNIRPSLTFKLLRDDPTGTLGADGALIVENNEAGFTEDNIEAICSVGDYKKKKDKGFIGEKGIGFKSVFRVTSRPFIFSNGYSISLPEFHNETGLGYIVPEWVENIPTQIDQSVTSIVLPLDKPEFGYEQVREMLSDFEPESMIFLAKLKEINIDLGNELNLSIIRDDSSGNKAKLLTVKDGQEKAVEYFVYKRIFAKPQDIYHEKRPDINEREISLAFPVDSGHVGVGKLFAYLPVRSDTGFPFIINADFILPSSREDIQDVPWNRDWLMKCVGELVAEALPHLRDNGLLSIPFLNTLVKRINSLEKNSLYFHIAIEVKKALSNQELLPADDGTFVSAENAKLAGSAELRKILTQAQLCQLFQSPPSIKWLAGDITRTRTRDLHNYLLSELAVDEVTPEKFAQTITYSFLSCQPDDWFVDYYRYLSGQEALWRAPRWERDSPGILRSKPILRLNDGRQVAPFKGGGSTLNAFLPPPEETDYPIVRRSIVKDGQCLAFLEDLGLAEPDLFDDIVEKVLPKYSKTGREAVTDAEYKTDINKIFRAMRSDSKAGRIKVIEAAKQAPFLKATNPAGDTSFKKPIEIYISSPELWQYFANTDTVWFLSDECYSLEADNDVWHEFGVSRLPRISHFEMSYDRFPRKAEGNSHKKEIIHLEGLEQALNNLPNLISSEQLDHSKNLWNIVVSVLQSTPGLFRAKYTWHHYKQKCEYISSNVLDLLQRSAWIPHKDGTLKRPGELTKDQLLEEYWGATDLIEGLGIVESADQSEEKRKQELANQYGISADVLEFAKNNPDRIQQLIAEDLKSKEGPSFPTRSVPNPERRQEHLVEQLSEAPDKEYEKRERSVRTTNGAIDPITWLRQQYTNEAEQMFCQMCKEEMPFRKRDGTHYFEKKEVLSRKYLPKELEPQYLALCPVCAAKYEEFVKSDDDAMAELKQAIVGAEDCEVPITLDQETSIRFVETHLLALKKTIIETSESGGGPN